MGDQHPPFDGERLQKAERGRSVVVDAAAITGFSVALAQGAVVGAGRFVAAMMAALTPLLPQLGVTSFYLLFALLNFIGVGTAWVVYRSRD